MNFETLYLIIPVVLPAFAAKLWIVTTRRHAQQPAGLSGFATARRLLDAAQLQNVAIEQISGRDNNYYDSRQKVLRLSGEIYHGRTSAAVGIAALEAAHAMQHGSWLQSIRNLAVTSASFGSSVAWVSLMLGIVLRFPPLLTLGVFVFLGVTLMQLFNLPGEFDAGRKAKKMLAGLDIIDSSTVTTIHRTINAASLFYLAAMLQVVFVPLGYVIRLLGGR